MCELCANACRGATTRRGALGLSFSALTAAFAISSGNQHQKTPPETQNVIAPDAALDRLMKGNDRYVQGVCAGTISLTSARRWPADRIRSPLC